MEYKYEISPKIYDYIRKKFGKSHIYKLDKNDLVFAFDPKIVEELCITKYEDFKKDGAFKRMKMVLGDGLLTSEEPKHLNNKRQISPSFSSNKMHGYTLEMQRIINSTITKFKDNEQINIQDLCTVIVYETVMNTLFSYSGENIYKVLKENIDRASDGIAFDNMDLNSAKVVREICEKIVNDRIAEKNKNSDFLGTLIQSYEDKKISLQDLYDEAVTIFVSSYETTSYAMSWAILYLCERPDWQDILNKDYDLIMQGDIYENIKNSENCRAFLNEVLRLCPPIWSSERIAIKDTSLNGIPIKEGTKVIISSFATHRDQDIYIDPYNFIPERWFDISDSDLPNGAYIPFLTGKRMCIGKYFAETECKIVLLELCKNFQISLVGDFPQEKNGLTYRFNENTLMQIKKR